MSPFPSYIVLSQKSVTFQTAAVQIDFHDSIIPLQLHGNQVLPKRPDVELRNEYRYSFSISASERPVIKRISESGYLRSAISFAVSRFA